MLSRFVNGVLLMDVFYRDGPGLIVSHGLCEGFRPTRLRYVKGVKAIIRPLEDQGILKQRSHTMLERDIEKVVFLERDGIGMACLSLTGMDDELEWVDLV